MLVEKIRPSHGDCGTATHDKRMVGVAHPHYFFLDYGPHVIAALLLLTGNVALADEVDSFLKSRIRVDRQSRQSRRDFRRFGVLSLNRAHCQGSNHCQSTKDKCSIESSKHRGDDLTKTHRSIDPVFQIDLVL